MLPQLLLPPKRSHSNLCELGQVETLPDSAYLFTFWPLGFHHVTFNQLNFCRPRARRLGCWLQLLLPRSLHIRSRLACGEVSWGKPFGLGGSVFVLLGLFFFKLGLVMGRSVGWLALRPSHSNLHSIPQRSSTRLAGLFLPRPPFCFEALDNKKSTTPRGLNKRAGWPCPFFLGWGGGVGRVGVEANLIFSLPEFPTSRGWSMSVWPIHSVGSEI